MNTDERRRRLAALKRKIHSEAYLRHAVAHLTAGRLDDLVRAVLGRPRPDGRPSRGASN